MINHGNGVLTTGRNRALKPEKASERTPEKERNENGLENGLQIREAGRKWAKLQKQTQGFFMEVVLRTLILSLMLLANSKMVRAASITWTNTAGGDWNNALNWNPNLVPGSGDSASIPSGALNVIIDSTNATGSLTLGNGSTLTIATNGVLDIEAPFTIEGEVTNAGTVNWQAGTIEVLGPAGGYTGEIWNQAGALWDIQCDAPLQGGFGGETFHNAGVVQKDTTTGTTSFNIYLANSGSLNAESGTIALNENYTETSLAKQMISIGGTEPNTSYGQIQFASPHFAGSFNITLLNGFRPNPGDSFSLLSYPSLTGDFNSMNGLDLGNGLKLVPHFSNTSLSLTAAAYSENSRPALSIYPTPSDELVSWPLNFTGWQLLTSTNLSTAAWTGIAVPGTNNNIVLPRNGVKGFYRLKSN